MDTFVVRMIADHTRRVRAAFDFEYPAAIDLADEENQEMCPRSACPGSDKSCIVTGKNAPKHKAIGNSCCISRRFLTKPRH